MSGILGQNGIVALALFASIALAMVALVLAWEGIRRLQRQRSLVTQLRALGKPGSIAAAGGGGLLRAVEKQGPAWAEQILLRLPHQRDLKNFLEQGDVGWTVGTFLMMTVGSAAAFGLSAMVLLPAPMPLAAAAAGSVIPYMYVARRRKKRFAKFEEHFPEAIDILGRAIRAGHAFSTGLEVVADEANAPVSDEFRQVYEEQKFGLPLPESLLSLADRIAILDVRIFVTAIMIQRESGGNLAEILDNLAYVIRERFKFRRQLRVHTAHGRMTGYVLAVAPIIAGMGMYMLNPDYMGVLFGFLVIRKLVQIKY